MFKGFKLFFVVSLLSVFLSGCSTAVVKGGNYDGIRNLDQGKGTVFIYRESAFAGGANQYDVLVDGVLAGSLPNGSFFTVGVEPGERTVKADTGSFGKSAKVLVESGKAQCLKMTLNFCVGCKSADIEPVGSEQCDNEIKSLTKVRLNK